MGAVRQFRAKVSARPDSERVTPLRTGRLEHRDNLPLRLTHFVGREAQLERIRQLVGAERLLTLTGTGGIGKTRLAIEAATLLRDDFHDGVWLVDLTPLGQSALVPQAVAEPLGLRVEADVSLQQALIDYLHPRQVLLLLDNCEHLIDACASLAETLLQVCPEVRILATSREPLHIAGEVTWSVPPLSLPGPSATASAKRLGQFEAVGLFVDRASAASGFVLADDNAATVARLCQRLDGIPLAIELAAARTGVLSVEQIDQRLDDRFRLLISGSRTAPRRQQTLAGALDWSYDLLTPAEQLLFQRVSVFAGGWTLEAAEGVCVGDAIAAEDVLDLLARLIDKSLVTVDPASAGHARYRLLDSVRQYAQDRLQECDSAAAAEVQRRHCAYYTALAEEAENQILWGAADVEWLARLDPEQGNVRAALGWSLASAGDAPMGLGLAEHLGYYWYTRGDRGEGRGWLNQLLSVVTREVRPDSGDRATRAWALLWAGGLAHGQSDYVAAVPLLESALAEFESLKDRRGVGWALSFLGHEARARADLARAADFLERAILAFHAIGDDLNVISPLAALGFTVALQGDRVRSMALLEESVTLARRTGSRGRLAIASIYFGQVATAQGDTRRAADAWQTGLQLSREWGSAWGMAECLEGLAVMSGAADQAVRAARLLGAAARLRSTIGAPVHPVDRADHERTIASVQIAIGAQAYASAWATGQAMPLDEVIEYAITGREIAPPPTTTGVTLLTTRELEVVALIARGMSNRDVADKLVIAERTVTSHVEHIFNKLGFRSRAQVAAWATEQRLTLDKS